MAVEPAIYRKHTIDGEEFGWVITTTHGDAVATTAIHGSNFGRHIGGVRFVERRQNDGVLDGLREVAHLSSTMTAKCGAASIRADGQKTVILANPEVLESTDRKASILVEHARAVIDQCGAVIFGPDMNNSEVVQSQAAQAPGLLDHFTGLTPEMCGLSIDANGYTAHGLVQAIETCLGGSDLRGKRITIQGWGAVGAQVGGLLQTRGATIVGISDVESLIVGDAIDATALLASWKENGDIGLRQHAKRARNVEVSRYPNELLKVKTDIFVPAARTAILGCADELDGIREKENPDVQDVADFLAATGTQLVVEGANHPLSMAAERFLEELGVRVLPDYIVNCGGLIGCWAEWEARHSKGITATDDFDRIAAAALERIRRTVDQNVRELLASSLPVREAATRIADRNRMLLMSVSVR